MSYGINRATVIGAGTMGAAIAGHLANAGVPVTLLDITPTSLTPEEEKAGLTLDHPTVRKILFAGESDAHGQDVARNTSRLRAVTEVALFVGIKVDVDWVL